MTSFTSSIRFSLHAYKQSNELTEAAYYLPLQAKRVLWLCL
ncbi:replication initiation protein, partial [Escherichia coli]|nr:replication initiation protein [Escherichia coli]